MEQKATFDRIATLYGAARPGYPDALVDDVCGYAGLAPGDSVLEVGCGAGQATASFAPRGYRLTALDPGPALIKVANSKLPDAQGIGFVVAPFEAWDPAGATFKLVYSAQVWHWIPPEIAFAKAAECLADRGVLAVFGHVPVALAAPFGPAFRSLYLRHFGAFGPPPESGYLPGGPFAGWFDASDRFEAVVHRCYRWSWRHTAESYVAFARTRSDHQMLPAEKLDALLADIGDAIAAHGGVFDWPYETHLYMARRR